MAAHEKRPGGFPGPRSLIFFGRPCGQPTVCDVQGSRFAVFSYRNHRQVLLALMGHSKMGLLVHSMKVLVRSMVLGSKNYDAC